MGEIRSIHTSCPTDTCHAKFLQSSLLKKTEKSLILQCRVCENKYELNNTEEQTVYLKKLYGRPSENKLLKTIDQLVLGDVISFKKRKLRIIKYHHHAVVIDIDREHGTVTLVEFQPTFFPHRKRDVILQKDKNFNELINDEKTVEVNIQLHMPMDCLPVGEVLERANAFIENRKAQPKYHLTRFNCQHLASYCKTGEPKSKEADILRVFENGFIHVAHVTCSVVAPIGFRFFPVVGKIFTAIGIGIFAFDVVKRIVSLIRENKFVQKNLKSRLKAYGPDVISIFINSLLTALTIALNGINLPI